MKNITWYHWCEPQYDYVTTDEPICGWCMQDKTEQWKIFSEQKRPAPFIGDRSVFGIGVKS